jgi:3-oxoadipate enol-lactonase
VDGPIPDLPTGHPIDLPGRGRSWVYDSDAEGAPMGAESDRPTLVLLHGWTSTAALNWCRCFGPLSRQSRVIALDQRGHGLGIRSRRPFRLEDCADDAATLVEQLDLGAVIPVGYSMGGPIAQLFWQRHPDLVKGLVLCATAGRFAGRPELNGPVGTLGYGLGLALSGLPANLLRPGYGAIVRNRANEQGVAPWAIREWERNDPAALIQAGFALGRFDSTAWTASIDVPTSVIVTTLDVTVGPARQWRLAQSIPGAIAFPVAGTHRACVDQAVLFVPALVAACQAVARPQVDLAARAVS